MAHLTQLPYPAEPPTAPDQVAESGPGSLPSVWHRAGARLFDTLIMEVPLLVLSLPYVDASDPERIARDFPHWLVIAMAVTPIVFDLVFVLWRRATPGKMLLGIEVRNYADGGRLAFHQVAYRALIPHIGGIISLVWVAEGAQSFLAFITPFVFITAVYHPLRRGIHDRAAGTIVLRNR